MSITLNSPRISEAKQFSEAERFDTVATADLDPLLERIGSARVVCLGEASHGTSEFYRMRQRITQALIEQKGFTVVAAEADWPDAARLDAWARGGPVRLEPRRIFDRFPSWMWRNREVHDFIAWLRDYNQGRDDAAKASFHGLDVYSLYRSIDDVLAFLSERDEELAEFARRRYACLEPFAPEPQDYGRAALLGVYEGCEDAVVAMLKDLLRKRLEAPKAEREAWFDAEQNARVVAGAEEYYRLMYRGRHSSWNLRDNHMHETLGHLRAVRGPDAKAVVWAHNSHLGDARATGMGSRGELNLGQLCREDSREETFLIGFGSDHGTVFAADDWGEQGRAMSLRPALPDSVEHACHRFEAAENFFLPVGGREEWSSLALERAVGVIYRPKTERQSHYFTTRLSEQFDEYIWIDETHALEPIGEDRSLPEDHPFLLTD